MRRYRSPILLLALLVAPFIPGCSGERASEEPDSVVADTPATTVTASSDSTHIINRAWQVASSSAGDPGQLYTFLSDGTLLIASAHGVPFVGAWVYAPGRLTFVEEGPAFTLDIVRATADSLHVRGEYTGGPLEIVFVPARRGRAR